MKNKKGFTLVELLAVIVVLAILILIAVTAVLPQIEKSRKNSFYDEALIYKREAEKAYIAESIDGTTTTCFPVQLANSDIALNGNYVKKNGASSYKGKVVLDSSGNISKLYLQNGKYMVVKDSGADSLAKSDVKKYATTGTPAWNANYESCQSGE